MPERRSDEHFRELIEAMSFDAGSSVLEPVELYGGDAERKLRRSAPAIVKFGGRWVGLLRATGKRAVLVEADGARRRVRFETLWREVVEEAAAPHRGAAEQLAGRCGVPAGRRERAVDALIGERIRGQRIGVLYELRTPAGAGFAGQLREAGVGLRAAVLVGAHLGEYALWIAAWWILGSGALSGRLDRGLLAAWPLMLATIVPLRVLKTWTQGGLAIRGGGLLRQRLLEGALKLTPEEVRNEGAGSFLGRAIEAESIEALALGGGVASLLAGIDLALACAVICAGAGAGLLVPLLAAALALTGWLSRRYWKARERWTDCRLRMTGGLIETMTGHRTRLAQQPPEDWHVNEDHALSGYIDLSRSLDREAARLFALAPRTWLVMGIAGLAPAFLAGGSASPARLAVALGGILLAWQALRRLAGGLAQLAGAAISWRQVATLFHAAARTEGASNLEAPGNEEVVVDARDVVFRHGERADAVLNGLSLVVRRGDWVLLEGESGGGKSTLAAVLAGLRQPAAGIVVRNGRTTVAPQYHENHILTGTFAYNLLLGRGWPPAEADLAEAQAVADELGLGPLIERMPGGMFQMVGETGWQLSQGERSRVFLARALLENPELVVLDESFAALDPENLRSSLECALRRAKSLLVVAHP